jgi:uncharacterized protein (TIGR03545 family)
MKEQKKRIEKIHRTAKTTKIPSLFKKPISQRRFEKRYLKLLAQKSDIDLLKASFSLKDGMYRLKDGLEASTLKRLAILSKAIRANTGWIKTGPLLATAIVLGALTAFFIMFANPLLEKGAEKALQGIFQAKVDIQDLRLTLLGPSLSFKAMSAADKDEPMTNLVELGSTEFSLDWGHLLRGRFFLRTGRIERMAFGTARTFSGALPEYVSPSKQKKESSSFGSGIVNLAGFDVSALLEQQKDKLKTTAALETAKAAWEKAAKEWPARVESSTAAVQDFQVSVERLRSLDVKNIKSVGEVNSYLSEAKSAVQNGKTLVSEAKAISGGITRDVDAAKLLEKEARSAVEKDMAYLKSFMDPKSGAAFNALEPVMEQVLTDKAQLAVYYGKKALDLLGRLRSSKDDDTKEGAKPKKPASITKGRTVDFPLRGYSRFRLGECVSSFNDGIRDWYIRLSDISTEPELLGAPSALTVQVDARTWEITIDASADTKFSDSVPWQFSASGSGLQVTLEEELAVLGVQGFSGVSSGSLKGQGKKKDTLLNADIFVTEPKIREASGSVGSSLKQALAKVKSIDLSVAYQDTDDQKASFTVRSNLDTIIGDVLGDLAATALKKASTELEGKLSTRVEQELGESAAAKISLGSLGHEASGNVSTVQKGQSAVDAKVQELETKARSFVGDSLKGLSLPGFKP